MSNRQGGYIGNTPSSWESVQYSGIWSLYNQYEGNKDGEWVGKPFDLEYARYTGVSTDTTPVTINIQSISARSDGSELFLLSAKGNAEGVIKINLEENWDLSSASNVGVASTAIFVFNAPGIPFNIVNISAQDTDPRGIELSPDGTRLYVSGFTNDKVYQYDLSPAWDLSSATFDTDFLTSSVAGLNPYAIGFNTNGTQLFVCGASGIGQYYLSTPYDIGTVNATPNPVSVSSQDINPYGIYINPLGDKVYISGISNDRIYQYSLSSSYALPSLTYDSTFFSVTSQGTDPSSVEFKDDGTEMYVLLLSNDKIFQYTLGTPWDISTAGLTTSFGVNAQEATPQGIRFGNDGQYLYVTGGSGDDVNQYTLGTAWDVSTAGFTTNFSVSPEGETAPTGIYFKSDGLSFYVIGTTLDTVLKYDLGTPWDISTATFSTSFSVTSQETTPSDLYFSPDGLQMHILGYAGDDITTYRLSTAWDPSTASLETYAYATVNAGTPIGIGVSSTKIAVFGTSDRIDQYSYSPQYGGRLSYVGSSGITTTSANTGFTFIDDGKRFVVNGVNYFREYRCSSSNYDVYSTITLGEGFFMKPEEDMLYVLDSTADEVVQFSLETSGDISFFNVENRFSVSSEETVPNGIFFKPEGDKMYIVGSTGDDVNEYSLSVPWDVSSAGFTTNFKVSSEEAVPNDIFFKPEGDKMYITGQSGDDVNEYSLSVPWDVSSAGFTTNFSVNANTAPESITFTNDGLTMLIGGAAPVSRIDVYVLETPWDVSSAKKFYSKDINYESSSALNIITGLRFSSDGSKLYVTDNNMIAQYELPTPWSVSKTYLKNIHNYTLGFTEIDSKATDTYVAELNLDDMRIGGSNGEYLYGVGETFVMQTKLFSKNTLMTMNLQTPVAMTFSADGKTFFVCDSTNDLIMKFSLDTPYDLYDPTNVTSNGMIALNGNLFTSFISAISGIALANDGKTLYAVGTTSDSIMKIYFPNDDYISFAALPLRKSLNFTLVDNTISTFFMREDGRKLYFIGIQNDAVYQYDLSIPFDFTSLTGIPTSFSVATEELNAYGLDFKTDGTKMYVTGISRDNIIEYSLSSPWDISSAGYATSISSNNLNPYVVRFKPDGTKMFVRGQNYIDEYSVSSPWDISTAGFTTSTNKTGQYYGLEFDADGSNLFVLWNDAATIVQFELENNWSIDSISVPGISSCILPQGSNYNFYFTPRKERLKENDPVGIGTNTYLTGGHALITLDDVDTMREYILPHSIYNRSPKISLTIPAAGGLYDNQINDMLTDVVAFDGGICIRRQETTSSGLTLSSDNTKIFMTGRTNDLILQYKINDPENIEAGITYENYLYVGAGTSTNQLNPYGVAFSPDGTKMYSAGQIPDTIDEYNVSNLNNRR
jgi:sugar lactone lactonase YvrE